MNSTMIAQLPDPNHFGSIGWLIVCLAAVSVAINSVWKLADRVKGRAQQREIQQPFIVEAAAQFARKEDFMAHASHVEHRLDEQDHDRQALRAAIERDRAAWEQSARVRSAGIYAKIDEVRKELDTAHTALRTEITRNFQDTERALGRIEGKLQSLARDHER